MAAAPSAGVESLHRLKQTEPPMYLTPSPELANIARTASEHLFALLKPYTSKSPFHRLLVDDNFDAEQIWQQIDLQSQPLISAVARQVNKFEKHPQEVTNIFKTGESEQQKRSELVLERENNDNDNDNDEDDDDMEEEEDDDEIEDIERGIKGRNKSGLDDKFFSLKELNNVDDEEEEEEEDDDDEVGILEMAGDEDDSEAEEIRYDDFFTSNKKPKVKKEVGDMNMSEEEENEDEDEDEDEDDDKDEDEENYEMSSDDEIKEENLSTHEKQLLEQKAKIEQVEKESLDAKSWTMQGEVNATKRPKNSALEVDLDWEHNAKPPPVITEEVSQSIEELIMKRIAEGHFDDVQKVNRLPSKAPREMKELDENQSKKGLGELYADEYAQKTGLVSQALSFSDEQKKEASLLFKRLCLKLDALSHFHFTPKPVIEDMTIKTNVPALAMEEIAPLAVSDAAMLAPEEVFSGKGDIKEEAELTQADRKRRRASIKRKFKAENAKKMAKKPRENTQTANDGKEES